MIIIEKFFPIILLFFGSYLLKKINIFKISDSDILLKIVLYLSIPALTIQEVSKISFDKNYIVLFFSAIITLIVSSLVAFIVTKFSKMKRKTTGTFILGSMILNTGFSLPFFLSIYGEKIFPYYILFDTGNCLAIYTFAFYVATKFGNEKIKWSSIFKKIFSIPPIWALIIALTINFYNLKLGTNINNFLEILSKPISFMIMISLGINFTFRIKNIKRILLVLFIRMGFGLFIGILIAHLFNLNHFSKLVVIIGSAAPVGFNTLIFSDLEKLDKPFASNLVSLSIFVGIFYYFILFSIFKI